VPDKCVNIKILTVICWLRSSNLIDSFVQVLDNNI